MPDQRNASNGFAPNERGDAIKTYMHDVAAIDAAARRAGCAAVGDGEAARADAVAAEREQQTRTEPTRHASAQPNALTAAPSVMSVPTHDPT